MQMLQNASCLREEKSLQVTHGQQRILCVRNMLYRLYTKVLLAVILQEGDPTASAACGGFGMDPLTLQLPRWMFMGPGGPWPCLKSPDALFSIVLCG